MEKILISGTGRCGTTFLIRLFTFLEFDTGYTKQNFMKSIFKNCNSGMEKNINDKHYILKNPNFILDIEKILKSMKIKKMIIPIRNYHDSAASREKHGKAAGGLWHATNTDSQLSFYYKIISQYTYYMTKYDIPTIFLDFERMTSDKTYLYEKLKPILDEKNIKFETFSKVYDEVDVLSKRK